MTDTDMSLAAEKRMIISSATCQCWSIVAARQYCLIRSSQCRKFVSVSSVLVGFSQFSVCFIQSVLRLFDSVSSVLVSFGQFSACLIRSVQCLFDSVSSVLVSFGQFSACSIQSFQCLFHSVSSVLA